MWTSMAAFGRNDLRNVRRDTMLIGIVFGPFLYSIMLWLLPPITRLFDRLYGFDLVPYYPLAISGFQILGPAAVLGCIGGMLLLEDKDQRTWSALRVTPAPPLAYPLYRVLMLVAITPVFEIAALSLSQRMDADDIVAAIPITVVAGFTTAILATTIALLAKNKVEGLALFRAGGMLVFMVPLVPWFIDSPLGLLFGVLPPYWAAKGFWVMMDGGNHWPYTVAGALYGGFLVTLLLRRLGRSGT